ncbi:hypothetical protein ACC713_36820, partial [Rhizobium johnstonii]
RDDDVGFLGRYVTIDANQLLARGKLVYGMNRGSVGFMMNDYRTDRLQERICVAVENVFRPLQMTTANDDGTNSTALAINEVYLFRQSYQ